MSESSIPVVLVTGFLGSGKTTFLRRLAEDHPSRHLVFLVNEIADRSVDGALLSLTNRPTHSVVGGSLFCECKAGEFVAVMRETVRRQHQSKSLDAVVIETSGIADPAAIGRLMHEHGLSAWFSVSRIVAIVAPRRFRTMVENLPAVRAQIETSDLVILNKTDLATADEIAEATSMVRAIRPDAEIRRATFGRLAYDFAKMKPILPRAELTTCDANPFTTAVLTFARPMARSALQSWLDALPTSILRVKGTVLTHDGWWHVQQTVDGAEISPAELGGDSSLVVIVHDDYAATLSVEARKLEHAVYETI